MERVRFRIFERRIAIPSPRRDMREKNMTKKTAIVFIFLSHSTNQCKNTTAA